MVKKTNGNGSKGTFIFFFGVVPTFTSVLIGILIREWYYKFQMSVFSTGSTLLFIHSNVVDLIIFFSLAIISFCIMLSVKNNISIRIMKIKISSFIAIVIFIISAFMLIILFFECTDINKEKIYVRNVIYSTNKNYMWNDVTYAEASYKRGYKNKIEITYDIHLKDGTIVNALNSKDFFSNIINLDNFMKDKKIEIIRSNIQSSDYKDFQDRFQDDNHMEVVLEIFNK